MEPIHAHVLVRFIEWHVVQEGDPEPYLSLEGWFIRPFAEASADQQTGDLIPLTAGVWCVSGQTDDRPATTV